MAAGTGSESSGAGVGSGRRVVAALGGLALVAGLGVWGLRALGDGRPCDDGRGIRINTACVDLDETFLETSLDGIDDIRLLEDLHDLQGLEVTLDDVDGDLAGIGALTDLEHLVIDGDGEEVDLAELAALTGLARLELRGFSGRNLAGLTLPALTSLTISEMDLDGPVTAPELVSLEIWTPGDLAVGDLAGVPQLRDLEIRDAGPVETDALAELVLLERLVIHAAAGATLDIDDFAFAAGMSNLEELELDGGGTATDLSPLTHLPLRRLHLAHFPIVDLAPLGELLTLEDLRLQDTEVSNLRPLAPLTGLTSLSVAGSNLRTMAGIETLSSLETLDLYDTSITDLGPVADITGLTTLRLDKSQVSDLAALAGLARLTHLSLWGTPVTDISSLEGLPLNSLDLNQTATASVAPLDRMVTLESLRLGSTPVVDLSPLRDLPQLEYLVPPEGVAAGSRDEVVELLGGDA